MAAWDKHTGYGVVPLGGVYGSVDEVVVIQMGLNDTRPDANVARCSPD